MVKKATRAVAFDELLSQRTVTCNERLKLKRIFEAVCVRSTSLHIKLISRLLEILALCIRSTLFFSISVHERREAPRKEQVDL